MNNEANYEEYMESLNRVFPYIEQHLNQKLSLEEISEVAGFSRFHFHRIFNAFIGETLGDHIRRIRLDKIAYRLLHTRESVTRIALDWGYETPAALTRAFRKQFGKTPTAFRKERSPIVLNGAAPIFRKHEEVMEMNPEVKTINDQTVIFVRKSGNYAKAAEISWKKVMEFAGKSNLINGDSKYIGISYDDPDVTEEENLRYDACITINKEVFPEGEVGVQVIKGGLFAVFLHEGSYNNLKQTYRNIFGNWLPKSGMKPRDVPCLEVYHSCAEQVKEEDMRTEIYIPVER